MSSLKCKRKLRSFPEDKNSNRRKILANFTKNCVNWPTKNCDTLMVYLNPRLIWKSSKIVWKHLRQKIRAATILEEIQLVPSPRIFPKSLEHPAWWKCWLFCLFGFFLENSSQWIRKKCSMTTCLLQKWLHFMQQMKVSFSD